MKNIVEWIQAATRPILLKKDREQAAQELEDHFEDHCSVLTARGLSLVQAEQETLAAMGDAKETGLLLRQAYQPVLSLLWKISRWVLGGCLLLLITVSLTRLSFWTSVQGIEQRKQYLESLYTSAWDRQLLLSGESNEKVRIGWYRIQVEKAAAGLMLPGKQGEFKYINVLLRFDHPFWLAASDQVSYYITASDNLGNLYPNANSITGFVAEEETYLNASLVESWRGRYFIQLFLKWPEDTDLTALRYVDLIYRHSGQSFSFRVEFKEETP